MFSDVSNILSLLTLGSWGWWSGRLGNDFVLIFLHHCECPGVGVIG